jgi:4-amino-4-deoxy-L-arabinose transferase-like glycosyltransferase
MQRFLRGDLEDPGWARPAFLGLLLATGVLYLWGLGESGWANSFYSAAVQAGSESWKAFFFGSSDAASSITVDKTPLALWPMALSVRLFGLSGWSILVPQALEGIATVALLHHVVRRTTGSAAAGLVAGTVMALTPVAVLMFRFNNPDAMLTLLMVGAAAATLRAVEATRGPTSTSSAVGHPVRWLALGGALVGLAFLTKMLQAFLVLPALALAYLLCAHTPWGRRVGHLLVAFGSMLLAGGWWIAIVELWPAASRPYIGGSQDNSILELTLGYNGLGRLSGNETGSVGGGAGGGGWGETGILRLLNSEIGGQVAWLLPAAFVLGGAALWFGRRQVDLCAGVILWGTWLLVTAVTFSFMAGIFHAYYTVALAPAIAALVGIGAWVLWQHRTSLVATGVLSFTVALTSVLAFFLLDRTTDYLPWLKWAVVVLGLLSALAIAGAGHLPRRLALAAAAVAVVATLAGPAAYAVTTAATPHTGSIPSAGPASSGGPGGAPGGMRGAPGQGLPPGMAPGTAPGTTQAAPTGGGGMGGLLNGSTPSAAVTELLQTDAGSYTWTAAAVGSNNASGYQLASEEPVMAIGGFNGSDPSPTLAQFQQYVADGEIHWFVASGTGAGPRGGSNEIAAWVAATFTATTVDGATLYDLSGGIQ